MKKQRHGIEYMIYDGPKQTEQKIRTFTSALPTSKLKSYQLTTTQVMQYFEEHLKENLDDKFNITDFDARNTIIKMFLIEFAYRYTRTEMSERIRKPEMLITDFLKYCNDQYVTKKNVTIH